MYNVIEGKALGLNWLEKFPIWLDGAYVKLFDQAQHRSKFIKWLGYPVRSYQNPPTLQQTAITRSLCMHAFMT